MKKMCIQAACKTVKKTLSKHSPEILTGIGIAGMATSTVLAVRATPKALEKIGEKKEELNLREGEKLTVKETIGATWRCYIPSAAATTVSAACLIGASRVNWKRNAALATAYKITETALQEYRDKTIETIGARKEKTIREKIAQDKINDNPISQTVVLTKGNGEYTCYDVLSNRYFMSNRNKIEHAQNVLNDQLLRDEYASLNDLYYELGIPGTKLGDDLGWNMGRDGLIKLTISTLLAEDGEPCLTIVYKIEPKYKYYIIS